MVQGFNVQQLAGCILSVKSVLVLSLLLSSYQSAILDFGVVLMCLPPLEWAFSSQFTQLETPLQTPEEVCLFRDSRACQVDSHP